MDLGTIRRKLETRSYLSEAEIRYDFELVWGNCKKYNQPGSDIYKVADKLEKIFKNQLAQFGSLFIPKKRNPLDDIHMKEGDDGSFGTKVQFFKKIKELEPGKLRELIQELIRKHPGCIKDVSFSH